MLGADPPLISEPLLHHALAAAPMVLGFAIARRNHKRLSRGRQATERKRGSEVVANAGTTEVQVPVALRARKPAECKQI